MESTISMPVQAAPGGSLPRWYADAAQAVAAAEAVAAAVCPVSGATSKQDQRGAGHAAVVTTARRMDATAPQGARPGFELPDTSGFPHHWETPV